MKKKQKRYSAGPTEKKPSSVVKSRLIRIDSGKLRRQKGRQERAQSKRGGKEGGQRHRGLQRYKGWVFVCRPEEVT